MAQTETLSLAPAAGSGIGKLVFDALLADPQFIPLMVQAALGGLSATTSFYNPATREVIEKVDFKTRLQTWLALTAHAEGEPVKRIIHQHFGGEGRIDPGAALADSPELAAAVERELQKARWKHSGRQDHKKPKRAQPAELVEPEVSGPAGGF